ncbi:MAG: molecular chaperone HtpG [Chitinivibrionales bacterium]|nr:molecular chaperone HtpG [Chitinivibrionales bacterium]
MAESKTQQTAETTQTTTMTFQAEVKQLLNIMIHSLYSHKEVFLRELISNASDALDKVRFEAVRNTALVSSSDELAINIKLDSKAKTITISDNGIGMTKQEVIDNIGTIARSGSKVFLESLTGDQKADSNLIGRFGVGFYSVFMVASSVKLVTKRAGLDEPAVVWESSGISDYTIVEGQRQNHGTDITIYLKEEESKYSEYWTIHSLIKKYSDFIAFPIYLPNEKGKNEVVNETKPLWKRNPAEITPENYNDFYKQALSGFDTPLAVMHNKAEGVMEYSSLLYLPDEPPFDLFGMERKHGVKLYVKRVFIMDNCKELLPEYCRFVKGVVDSEDLPLNVSREMLQHNPIVEKIKKALVSRILTKLSELAQAQPDTYKKFWNNFGQVLKEGIYIDHENKEKLLDLLRFQSSLGASKEDLVSLRQYVDRMRSDQKDIYFISGENREIVEKSPHLEIFRDKGIEVLYMIDPIDEFIVPNIYNFDGKQLKSVTKGDLDLGDLGKEEESEKKKIGSQFKKFTERVANILTAEVKEVRVTTRLKDSPCCLVSDEHEMGSHMEKLMKAMGKEVPVAKRILEINGNHSLIKTLNQIYENEPKSSDLEEWIQLLYEQALIAEGTMVKNPVPFTQRINKLLLAVTQRKVS